MITKTQVYRDFKKENFTGIGIENPKLDQNVGVLFRTAAVLGVADFLFTIGLPYNRPHSDTCDSYRSVPIWNFSTFNDLLSRKPLGTEIYGVEMDDRSTSLVDVEWPDRVIILLGNEKNGLSKEARQSCRKLIKIPTKLSVSINVSSAGSVVMWDRYLKLLKDDS
jgi:tRNA G18 (ribose-2'-O)-methylase SpoU